MHVARLSGEARQHRPGLKVLEGVDQVVVAPAIDVEAGVAGCTELLQVVLPLLLMVDAVPLNDVPDLITNAHVFTLFRPNGGGLPPMKGRLELLSYGAPAHGAYPSMKRPFTSKVARQNQARHTGESRYPENPAEANREKRNDFLDTGSSAE